MKALKIIMTAGIAAVLALPVWAGDIQIKDAYLRTGSPMAKSGGAFLQIVNESDQDDRLISASSDVAKMVQLHTTVMTDGVMQMNEVPEGFAVAAGQTRVLERGGDHVMFMGLTRKLEIGDMVTVTLIFEKGGEMTVEIPFDPQR